MDFEQRYSDFPALKQEIVMLMGRGCFWKRCTFCDYYGDSGPDGQSVPLNRNVLQRVTGKYHRLVVLNSGSYFELPGETQAQIMAVCADQTITALHMESHWRFKDQVVALKKTLADAGIALHPRIGIETFDEGFREEVMDKGMGRGVTPKEIAGIFDECCLLFGMQGQSTGQFKKDLAIAKSHFKTVYLNLFNPNTTKVQADDNLVQWFIRNAPELKKDPQLVVLTEKTGLGVGD